MIRKIIVFLIFPMCIIALILALGGVQKVELDNTYYMFMRGVAERLDGWKLTIPKIPSIPILEDADGFRQVLNLLINFFNGIVKFLNIVINVLNAVINGVQFILTLLEYVVEYFGDYIANNVSA